MSSFFEELKRRKVYRVAVAYVVAAGGIIQLASAVFPAWQLPDWMLRVLVVLLLAGFPIALVLSWVFDFTPRGIESTPAATPAGPGSAPRRRNVYLLVALGLTISAATGFFLLPRASAHRTEKSIAVLPFENFSDDKGNVFFADGIQDDILTNLAKIGDLKVISRTSVMVYRNRPASLRDIGKALGVSAILEGSVRKIGNRVRVNVQLINAANDQHLWAEDYDRELTDVFAIQTDLAQKIAHALRTQLSPSEKEQITRKPTENGEAYLAFVEAHNLAAFLEDFAKLKQAIQLCERALELDPKFALAAANLSILHSWVFHNHEPTAAERELAGKNAELALSLEPDLPEAHLARGYFLYYAERDYAGALAEFAVAQRGLPNNSGVYLVIGAIQRRQGKWQESTANLEKAVSLNPNDTWPLQNLFFNYQVQRDFPAAERTINRALALAPDSFGLHSLLAKMAIAARGDFSVALEGLASLEKNLKSASGPPPGERNPGAEIAFAKGGVLYLQSKFADALAAFEQLPEDGATDGQPWRVEARLVEGVVRQRLGQTAKAREVLLKAKEAATAAVSYAPNDAARRAGRARILAALGEKDAAVAEAKKAIELLPESVDAFEGPGITEALAEVYAVTGENAKAIQVMSGLLERPGNLTVKLLQLDPTYDGLRQDPAFQKMLTEHGGKT